MGRGDRRPNEIDREADLDETRPNSTCETPDTHGEHPRLTDEQIEALAEYGERRRVEAGEVLYGEGERSDQLFVILDGLVSIVEAHGTPGERVIAVHGPGRFLGEQSVLAGQASFATAVMTEQGEVLSVPIDGLRQLVAQDAELGDLLLRACLVRRSMLIGRATGFRIIGSRHSPDTRRLRDFAARNRLPHSWIDLEEDETAEKLLRELGVSASETPVVIWGAGQVLRNPSNAELASLIGLRSIESGTVWDLIVVGAGPAGLATAVYGALEGLDTVVAEAVATGGQAGTSTRIDNYVGFPAGISGAELADRAVIQARRFGARLNVSAQATALDARDGQHVVRLDHGEELYGRAVVIATGAHYRRLDVPRREPLERTSIFYAATPAEAQLCVDDPVAVVGGGNSAGQAAVFLTRHAARVVLVVREEDLGDNMSRYLVDRIEQSPDVEVRRHTEVRELLGDESLEGLIVEDTHTGERRPIDARALFVFIGADPHTDWLASALTLDADGYIVTGSKHEWGRAALLETSRRGVFAAGDVRSGSIRRVASAIGEGSMSVLLVHQHLVGGNAPVPSGP